jgi:hypothetical protein
MRTCVRMLTRSREFEPTAGPLSGRVLLLFASYSPVAVIAGLRGLPGTFGCVAVGTGALGAAVWICFLLWLPNRQARECQIAGARFVDAEVTGYIVSILLPVVAASKPVLEDWLAYGACATLILLVAFSAELWSINPITYAFGLRAARATVDGKTQVILVRDQVVPDGVYFVARRAGVGVVLDPAPYDGEEEEGT